MPSGNNVTVTGKVTGAKNTFQMEIAAGLNLSINTVKLFVNSIYEKLNANSIVDVIRIAAERKLV